jgi:ABC-type lipoprotein release transport system permease subunit
MSAVWMRARAELRARARSWIGLALLPIALVLANIIAAIPARIAARTQPAVVLRSE